MTSNAPSSGNSSAFMKALDFKSSQSKSRIILALDFEHTGSTIDLSARAQKLVQATSEYLCGIKINFHLLLPLSLRKISAINEEAASLGLISIADIKLNDIDNTNRVTLEYLHDAHFSAVIVNPFVGYSGALDTVFQEAKSASMGIITLAYMSHGGADEGYGLKLDSGKTMFETFLERANNWGSDGVIVGSTRPDKIRRARAALQTRIKILSPGSGAQGGNSLEALEAGADYLIYGRSIVSNPYPAAAAREVYRSLLPWTETH
ncbi:MAG TPA: orotidine 5'-phosphate decarboxylase / HUMPS family protein [Nitrososphaerales archaeon]|nr:orotidine 5'-phosphate decarboxylase / HUMPS family protein [Nitrososphaerales archaeon]